MAKKKLELGVTVKCFLLIKVINVPVVLLGFKPWIPKWLIKYEVK